jgi:hypothetical protein
MELYDWLQCIVSAILCGILIFVVAGRVIGVDGTSMLQTLQHEDKVVMTDLFYTPKYGDIESNFSMSWPVAESETILKASKCAYGKKLLEMRMHSTFASDTGFTSGYWSTGSPRNAASTRSREDILGLAIRYLLVR